MSDVKEEPGKRDASFLLWRVNTPGLFQEIVSNPNTAIMLRPLQITGHLLALVAKRASELNDPQLNALMCRLALYEVCDPNSKEYDEELAEETMSYTAERRMRSING